MKKLELIFIVNPISGIGKQKIIESLVHKIIDTSKINYQIIYTQYAKHATQIATEYKNKVDVVAVVGGDGSVHETACGLLHSNTALAIIPTGSGNGLARHLNIPLSIDKAIALLNNFEIKKIDTGLLNNIPFVNVAGIGFDAFIIEQFSKNTTRGLATYLKIIISTIPFFKAIECTIKWNDGQYNGKVFMACAANITQFGNGAYIAPTANDTDENLNLVIIKKLNIFQLAILSFRLFTKTIHKSKHVIYKPLQEIKIHQNIDKVQLDGEYYTINSPLQFNVNPLSLSVVISKK